MSTKAVAISFIPIIVIGAIFASYVALTPAASTPIYSMPPPNSHTSTSDGWQFNATISHAEMGLGVSGNLTYVGTSNATYDFGVPLILCEIQAQNGTIVWGEITTMLLRQQTVAPGQTFSDSTQVPTSQLVLGQTYTLLVFPQVSGNGFSGHSVEQSFSFSPLAVTSQP
jgi:hypothetical protein